MVYNQQLIDIIKKKQFKNFWVCLEYLLIAGYSKMDAFGITMKEFGSDNMFTNVAFIKYNNNSVSSSLSYPRTEIKNELIIGLIDETNIHLSGIYEIYMNKISIKNSIKIKEIEDTCEIISLSNLNYLIIEYIFNIASEHFKLNLSEQLKIKIVDILPKYNHSAISPIYNFDSSDWIMNHDPASGTVRMMNRITGEIVNQDEYIRR